MNRRLVALLIVLAIGLQGPILAYADTVTAGHSANCCLGHGCGQTSEGSSPCCPAGGPAATCHTDSAVLTAIIASQSSPSALPLQFLTSESGSVPFATESLGPELRPPIV